MTTSACGPSHGEVGIFDAERTSCSFAAGTKVEFDATVPGNAVEVESWAFRVLHPSDALCADVGASATELVIETDRGTFSSARTGEALTITCPDGTQFRAPDWRDLQRCGGAAALPGFVAGEANGISFTWNGSTVPLWICE